MNENTRPHCKSCARYAGTSDTIRHGRACVYCRVTMQDTTLRPLRGGRTKNPIPCNDYIPKTQTHTLLALA